MDIEHARRAQEGGAMMSKKTVGAIVGGLVLKSRGGSLMKSGRLSVTVMFVVLVLASPGWAAPGGFPFPHYPFDDYYQCKNVFPATGQTTAYKADKNDGIVGNPVAVRDDGTVRFGGALNYQDNGDGTVTDLNTGLIWEKKLAFDDGTCLDRDQANRDPGCVNNDYLWSEPAGTVMSRETIWDFVDQMNAGFFAGHNDWRIPNVKELQSIVNYGLLDPAIDPRFRPTRPTFYWSSTTEARDTTYAWRVDFAQGTVEADNKAGLYPARAVRGCFGRIVPVKTAE